MIHFAEDFHENLWKFIEGFELKENRSQIRTTNHPFKIKFVRETLYRSNFVMNDDMFFSFTDFGTILNRTADSSVLVGEYLV